MKPHKKPGTPGDILKHHGVKGMHWGIRREDLGGLEKEAAAKAAAGLNAATKEYLSIVANARPRPPVEAAKALKTNKNKFAQKFEPAGGDSGKGLSQTQKDLLITAGLGAAYVGLVIAGKKYGVSAGPLLEELGKGALELHQEFAGKLVPPDEFQKLVGASQVKTWMFGGHIQEQSLLRDGFELPAGHTFNRLSTAAETEFESGTGTYATHSVEDYNRYVTNFRLEKGPVAMHSISFQSKAPIKVPSLTEVLETGREAWAGENILSREQATSIYEEISGGKWGKSTHSIQLMEALRKKGYGAIIDEMDAGVIGESPLVIFPDPENFTPKVSAPLTKFAINKAEGNTIELSDRKL